MIVLDFARRRVPNGGAGSDSAVFLGVYAEVALLR